MQTATLAVLMTFGIVSLFIDQLCKLLGGLESLIHAARKLWRTIHGNDDERGKERDDDQ